MEKLSKIFLGIFFLILLSPFVFFGGCVLGMAIPGGTGMFGNEQAGPVVGLIAVLIFIFFQIRYLIKVGRGIKNAEHQEVLR